MFHVDTITEELVTIPSNGARLAGCLSYQSDGRPGCAVLIAGAHPLLGGNSNNNVSTAMRRGLARRGLATLSFEYQPPLPPAHASIDWNSLLSEFWRTSHVSHEAAWLADSAAALRFLNDAVVAPSVLIGYSFGCWSVAELAKEGAAAALICISPNPLDHDLAGLKNAGSPILVITSDNDFSCPPDRLDAWFETLRTPKSLERLASAEHFFRRREEELVGIVADFLSRHRLLEG
jgi:alpha/beta superfamily hydrolase